MARKNEGILDLLVILPWWVSVITAVIAYLALTYVVPAISIDNPLLQGVLINAPTLAPLFAFILLVPAPLSALNAWRKRRQLDRQVDINSIRSLSWKQFEELIAEAYRRQGYRVVENAHAGADGGIDVRLIKNGHTHLVQCKQWKSKKVGVSIVREMYGVMVSKRATSAIIITSGDYTREARDFAIGRPIDLIDGPRLVELIGLTREPAADPVASHVSEAPRICPRCGSELALRTAKKGANAGSRFWGCAAFPNCRHTEPAEQSGTP
jgi:restriction system protein